MKKKKSKDTVVDIWDLILAGLFIVSSYLLYKTPTWTDPSLALQFAITVSDKIYGWLLGGLVLKKILENSNKE